MGDTRIRENGVGRVHERPGGSGDHVSMVSGGGLANFVGNGKWDVVIYPDPNPALAEVLLDGRLGTIVADYTAKIASTYHTMLAARSSRDEGTGTRLIDTIEANVWPYWGYKRDRWVGEVKVGSAAVPYGAADEFGRSNPEDGQKGSTYEGSRQLRTALYIYLPFKI